MEPNVNLNAGNVTEEKLATTIRDIFINECKLNQAAEPDAILRLDQYLKDNNLTVQHLSQLSKDQLMSIVKQIKA
jgi:hypothetical protein